MSERSERKTAYRLEVAAQLCGLSPGSVRYYVRAGLVTLTVADRDEPRFGEDELARLRKIRRLTADLGLNTAGVEVAMRLLDEVASLQAELDRHRLTGGLR